MKRINKHLVVLLLPLLISACVAATKTTGRPGWVDGGPGRYSAGLYLTGVGSGDTLDEAQDRARADLAKIFRVEVREESRFVERVERPSQGATRHSSAASSSVRTRTEGVLSGVTIAESWHDRAARRYYALAVLERRKAETALAEKIHALDEVTQRYLASAESENDMLRKIAWTARAVAAQEERGRTQSMLRVVDQTGLGIPAPWTHQQLQTRLTGLAGRITVAPVASGRAPGVVEQALAGALAEAGFLARSGGAAAYVVEAKLSWRDLGLREGWYWLAGSLDLVLRDAAGAVRGRRSWPIKESATRRELARQRAVAAATALIRSGLRDTLLEFAGAH
ncbi:MAG TPA: hypothetical protein ENJ19_04640 [Gammaproteobacteria bacterium]|nr:hypothetical protein [Gammaproteobacteria bacterium]